jgi:hypothetical protein
VANAKHADRAQRLGNLLSSLVSIATILGIPVALYGYYASQQAARVDRTFDFYKEFRTGEMQQDLNLLVDKFNARADEIRKLIDNGGDLGPLEDKLLQDANTKAALSKVVVFYDGMGSCVDHAVCDGNAAIALFQYQASQVLSMFGPHIQSQQKLIPTYGRGVYTVNGLTQQKWWWPWPTHSSN